MADFQQVLEKIQDSSDRKLLSWVHKKILSAGKNVNFVIFPIYIRYTKGENIIAVLYYNKKNFLDLGLNVNKSVIDAKFRRATYMKYPGINYSIQVGSVNDLSPKVVNFLKKL